MCIGTPWHDGSLVKSADGGLADGVDADVIAELLESNDEFRRLHDEHASLNARVDRLQRSSNPPIDDAEMEDIKKKRLRLKDRMARIIGTHRRQA